MNDNRYQITAVARGFDVVCPECGESLQVRDGQAKGHLVHDEDCSVYRQAQEVNKLLVPTTIQ